MNFKFKHKKTGEQKILTLSAKEIQPLITDELFDIFCESECRCQPVGETNVVDCNCLDYLEQFELIERT